MSAATDLTGLVRVDVLGQVLIEGIRAVQHDVDTSTDVFIGRPNVTPRINVESVNGTLVVYLDSGHVTVCTIIDITDPPGTGLFERSCLAAQKELT